MHAPGIPLGQPGARGGRGCPAPARLRVEGVPQVIPQPFQLLLHGRLAVGETVILLALPLYPH